MGKIQQKNKSEIEYFRGLIKKLKSENRHLKKRIKELNKREHFYEEIIDDVLDEEDGQLNCEACPSCETGVLVEVDLHRVKIKKCNQCDYRTKTSI